MPDECTPKLTRKEVQWLIVAAGSRLERLTKLRAGNVITGKELERRIDGWQVILAKLTACLGDVEE